METIWRWVETMCAVAAMLALGCLVALPALQVVLRDLFSSPLIGLEEGTRWGLITLVYMGLPLLVACNGQIRFAELVDLLPGAARAALERLSLLAGAGVLLTLLWAGLASVLKNSGTRTPVLDIPFWLFAAPFLAGLALTGLGCLYVALRRRPPSTTWSGQQL
jgi:TRAP-type C4-dicarboxylate transport system permease small subunit